MKKFAILLAVLVLVSAAAGCASKVEPFYVEGYGIEVAPGKGWSQVEESGYDLQLTNGKAYITVMAYAPDDFVDEPIPSDIYLNHNEVDVLLGRENASVKEEEKTYTAGGKTITTTLYSAEYNGTENHYLSCLVEFNNEEGIFAWVLFNGTAEHMDKNKGSYIKLVEKLVCDPPESFGEDDFEYIEGEYLEGEIIPEETYEDEYYEEEYVDETYEDGYFNGENTEETYINDGASPEEETSATEGN